MNSEGSDPNLSVSLRENDVGTPEKRRKESSKLG